MKILEILTEASMMKGHIDHPEDLVFSEGPDGAKRAVEALVRSAQVEHSITIKWDGFPALVFGRNERGELVVADKHMFDKKDGSGRVTSADAFRQYDLNRGADRRDLHQKIAVLWPAFDATVPPTPNQYYWGDLLYAGKPRAQRGMYLFKPNTVTYGIPAKSAIGQQVAQSVGGIAVHTSVDPTGVNKPLQDISGLKQGPILYVGSAMPIQLNIKAPAAAVRQATNTIQKNSAAVTTFLAQLESIKGKALVAAMHTFINSRISAGNLQNLIPGFYEYLYTKLSPAAQQRLLGANKDGWLYTQGAKGITGIFQIWVTVYNLKMAIKHQIDAHMAEFPIQASIDSTIGHEGYVTGAGTEKIKLVDRLAFSRANFAKTR